MHCQQSYILLRSDLTFHLSCGFRFSFYSFSFLFRIKQELYTAFVHRNFFIITVLLYFNIIVSYLMKYCTIPFQEFSNLVFHNFLFFTSVLSYKSVQSFSLGSFLTFFWGGFISQILAVTLIQHFPLFGFNLFIFDAFLFTFQSFCYFYNRIKQ